MDCRIRPVHADRTKRTQSESLRPKRRQIPQEVRKASTWVVSYMPGKVLSKCGILYYIHIIFGGIIKFVRK